MKQRCLSIILLAFAAACSFVSCGNQEMDSDGDVNDGDVQSDGDEPDGDDDDDDMADGDDDDGDEPDGDDDGDVEEEEFTECSGSCNPEKFKEACVDEDTLCRCYQSYQMAEIDCENYCRLEGHTGGDECGPNPELGIDMCWCYDESDPDPPEGPTKCFIALCSETIGCMDVGVGEGRGICFEQGQPDCAIPGEDCSEDQDGSRVCSDICNLTNTNCYRSCEAIPNTCAEGELCFPLAEGAEGTIEQGVCMDYGADCPDDSIDGDLDRDADEEMPEFEIDEMEYLVDADLD